MFRPFFILLIVLTTSTVNASCVILLHGLARSPSSLSKLEKQLKEHNFETVNIGYPSRKHSIEELADKAIKPALEKCNTNAEINFVTHSLGGILVRQYLSQNDIPNLNRVVMLGPPNQGSEVVDKLGKVPGFKLINGKAGLQLGTAKNSIPNKLGKVEFDLGIIAGTQSINWILSSFIPGTDDGKVSTESTKVEGMNDHIKLPTSHPFMMKNDAVIEQIIYYLKNGKFKKESF